MPLQAHKPLATGTFDGLNEQVVIHSGHPELIAQALYGLAMYAVGAYDRSSHKFSQPARLNDANGLHGQQQRAVPSIHPERGDVLAQGTTVKNVDELRASADAQYGNPDSFCLFQQELICRVAGPVITGTDLRFLTIAFRMDMSAP